MRWASVGLLGSYDVGPQEIVCLFPNCCSGVLSYVCIASAVGTNRLRGNLRMASNTWALLRLGATIRLLPPCPGDDHPGSGEFCCGETGSGLKLQQEDDDGETRGQCHEPEVGGM